jgi:tetratricopeptide (TPR) repeat protein
MGNPLRRFFVRAVGKTLVALLISLVLAGTVSAQRKLPVGTYISSAKIEILSGEQERYLTAIAMLDSLFMHYGPHAEGLYWMAKIMQDYIERTSDPTEKLEYVNRMVAYADSLKMCCDNKDIKKKYRKKCDSFISEIDSSRVLYWRSFYNDAVAQIDQINEAVTGLEQATDSVEQAYWQTQRDAMVDTCIATMALALAVDSTDARAFVGLATAYEKAGDLETSLQWLEKALDKSEDRNLMLSQIAYTYIRLNKYCDAIPFLREYVDNRTADTSIMSDPRDVESIVGTMTNLSICYNNCEQYDEAYAIYLRALEYDPDNTDVLTGAGRYHNHFARQASDSANAYQASDDQEAVEHWRNITDIRFDSARTYLKRSFELQPDNVAAAEEFGIIAAILGKFDEAKAAFQQVTTLEPNSGENWTSLGDCHLSLQEYAEAAQAYEKVVELDSSKKEVWERLRDLYIELGNDTRRTEVEEILKDL